MVSELLTAVLLGLISGSFFNMLIYRMTHQVSLLSPGFSFCPRCKHRLGIKDLIPIISYLLLGGKCRYCSQRISIAYLMMEIAAVVLAVMMVQSYGLTVVFLLRYFLYLLLIAAAVSDIKTGEIEYIFSLGSFVMVLLLKGFSVMSLYAAAATFIFFLSVAYFGKKIYQKDVFGGADILLLAVGSYFFETDKMFLFLYLPFVTGALGGIIILISKKQNIMAFAPFIVISFFVTDLLGWRILNWYLSLF